MGIYPYFLFMEESMKKVFAMLMLVLVISVVLNNVFAVVTDPGYDPSLINGNLKKKVKSIWATVAKIVQIASVACVVFAGLRYMFASSDQRADIKQGLIYLTIGAVLVFGAILIIQLVAEAGKTIMQ